jgi:hypothetical protein
MKKRGDPAATSYPDPNSVIRLLYVIRTTPARENARRTVWEFSRQDPDPDPKTGQAKEAPEESSENST